MTIICIKMKTGEDIIARVEAQMLTGVVDPLSEVPPRMPTGEVTLKDPRVISLQEIPDPQGRGARMALALLPYLMGDHEGSMIVNLHDTAVGVYKARSEIEKSYMQQTSSLDLSGIV